MINKVSGYKCPVIRDNSVHQRKSMTEGREIKRANAIVDEMQQTVTKFVG